MKPMASDYDIDRMLRRRALKAARTSTAGSAWNEPGLVVPCLTVQQPYASPIAAGVKPYENRTWWSGYRGPLLIHAGLGVDFIECMPIVRELWPQSPAEWSDLPRGPILAIVHMTDCVRTADSPWFYGPYAFRLEEAVRLRPFVVSGTRGIWPVPIRLLGPDIGLVEDYLRQRPSRMVPRPAGWPARFQEFDQIEDADEERTSRIRRRHRGMR